MAVYGANHGPGIVDTSDVQGWKIYYADGSVASSAESPWALAPATGVQVVVIYYGDNYEIWETDHFETQPYRTLLAQQDFYWRDAGENFGAGDVGGIPSPLPVGAVKTGSLLLDTQFMAIYNAALADMQVP